MTDYQNVRKNMEFPKSCCVLTPEEEQDLAFTKTVKSNYIMRDGLRGGEVGENCVKITHWIPIPAPPKNDINQ